MKFCEKKKYCVYILYCFTYTFYFRFKILNFTEKKSSCLFSNKVNCLVNQFVYKISEENVLKTYLNL